MCIGPFALAMFTWILGSESAERKDGKISTIPSFKNRGSVNGRDRDLSGDPGGFCQCPAFSA
jgi:hypothetical protein